MKAEISRTLISLVVGYSASSICGGDTSPGWKEIMDEEMANLKFYDVYGLVPHVGDS